MLEFVVIFFLLTVMVAVVFLAVLAVKAGLVYFPAIIKRLSKKIKRQQ